MMRSVAALACSLLVVAAAHADEAALAHRTVTLPAPASPPWKDLYFPTVPAQTLYASEDGVLHAESRCSASGFTLRIDPKVALAERPVLRWRWKVTKPPENRAAETSKAGDDFAARVYAFFDFDRERSSLWDRVQRTVAGALYGSELPGRAIAYLWAREVPAQAEWQSPYSEDTRNRVLRSGGFGAWQSERVDLRADHERLLGPVRMPLVGVAVMTDSDDGCSVAEAFYADFSLEFAP